MQKEASYYSGLLTGFISNTIPVEEVTELLTFIKEEPDTYKNLIKSKEIQVLLEQKAYNNAINIPEVVSMRMKERLMAAVNARDRRGRVRTLWTRIAAAAAIILFITFGAYFIFRPKATREIVQSPQPKNDVAAPAASKATITLSNGQAILVDSLNSGTLATQGNVKVVKTADGKIAYNVSGSSPLGEAGGGV